MKLWAAVGITSKSAKSYYKLSNGDMNVWTKLCDNEKVIFCGLWKTVKYFISSHCWDAVFSVWTVDINKDGQLPPLLPTAKSCEVALVTSFGANICTVVPEIWTCSTQFLHVCPPTQLRAQMSITIFHPLFMTYTWTDSRGRLRYFGLIFEKVQCLQSLYMVNILWKTSKI